MNNILEIVHVLAKVVYFYIIAIYKAVVPTEFLRKKNVKGKRVLITGSASGIGRQLAIEFGKLGAELILWDVNPNGNEETLRTLETNGVKATTFTVNLCDNKDINKTAETVRNEIGKVDILINNAGIASGKLLQELTDEMVDKSFAVNVKAHFYIVKNFLPQMLEDDKGHIVTIASVAGKMAGEGMTDYAASKHAAVGFHDCLSSEITLSGKHGVKTTLVCPYYIHTPMFDTSGAATTIPWLFPLLEVDYVVGKIVEAVLTEQEYLVMPKMFYLVIASLSWMPYKVQSLIGKYLGLIQDIDRFNRKLK